jgi:hypothetical protein
MRRGNSCRETETPARQWLIGVTAGELNFSLMGAGDQGHVRQLH